MLLTLKVLGGTWAEIARSVKGRTARQCRERWMNHLSPAVKKGHWTAKEDQTIIEEQKIHGNRWAVIARALPGRMGNDVKIRFKTLERNTARDQKDKQYRLDLKRKSRERDVLLGARRRRRTAEEKQRDAAKQREQAERAALVRTLTQKHAKEFGIRLPIETPAEAAPAEAAPAEAQEEAQKGPPAGKAPQSSFSSHVWNSCLVQGAAVGAAEEGPGRAAEERSSAAEEDTVSEDTVSEDSVSEDSVSAETVAAAAGAPSRATGAASGLAGAAKEAPRTAAGDPSGGAD
jgi:myb proto-oncogene protein